jgi:hypothetical protein
MWASTTNTSSDVTGLTLYFGDDSICPIRGGEFVTIATLWRHGVHIEQSFGVGSPLNTDRHEPRAFTHSFDFSLGSTGNMS